MDNLFGRAIARSLSPCTSDPEPTYRFADLLLGLLLCAQVSAQYIPPDLYGEDYHPGVALVPNRGQVVSSTGGPASEVGAYSMGLEPQLFMLKDSKMKLVWREKDTVATTLDTIHAIDVSLLSSIKKDPITVLEKPHYSNFYLPHCPPGGVEQVHGYSRSIYEGVYPFIDMHIYSGPVGMKMAFVIHPGGDPSHLQLKFEGQDSLRYDYTGMLKAYLKEKYIVLPEAVAYQVDANNNVLPIGWTVEYVANTNTGVSTFNCPDHDPTLPLVLQIGPPPLLGGPVETPGVCWATYWNGAGSSRAEVCTVDESDITQERQYVAGVTFSDFLSFPPFIGTGTQYTFQDHALYLSKFMPTGIALWTDFYGASEGLRANGLATTGSHDVFMVGACEGTGLWEEHTGPEFFGPTNRNGFIARFNSDGFIEWSTYFNHCDDAAVVNGGLVVTGNTTGADLFEPSFQPPGATYYPFNGGHDWDAFIAQFTSGNELVWSTYLGGTGGELARGVATWNGHITVVGTTWSSTMSCTMDGGPNAFDQSSNSGPGTWDVWLVRFNSNGVQEWGTFWGGSSGETWSSFGGHLAVEPTTGDMYISGTTSSGDLPYEPGSNWSIEPYAFSPGNNGYIAQFDGATYALEYSTFIGGDTIAPVYQPRSLTVSKDGDLFVTGTMADDSAIEATPYTGLYYADTYTNDDDAFILWLSPSKQLNWFTHFGGEEEVSEGIEHLAYSNTSKILYAAGFTSADYSGGDFFPLTERELPSYFSPVGYEPFASFIAAFCTDEIPVQVSEVMNSEPLIAVSIANGVLEITGLAETPHSYELFDLQGRMVLSSKNSEQHDRTVRIQLPNLPSALYILRIDGVSLPLPALRY